MARQAGAEQGGAEDGGGRPGPADAAGGPEAAPRRASWLGGIGAALGHRDYRLYSLGASASFLGTWIYRTGLGWFAWELTHSPAWLGIVVFCEVVPIIALVPITGAVVDRLGAYRIFRAAQISGSAVMALMALLTALDAMTIELLAALVALNGVNMSVMQPAFFALVANLVPRSDLSSAIALQSALVQTARFIGPAVAGGLLVWSGAAAAFAVNAVSYLCLVAAMVALSFRDPARPASLARGLLGDVAQGARYIAGHEAIRTLLLMTVAFSVLLRPVVELLPAFASEVFDRGADGLATLLSAAGAGAIVGSLWLARRGRTHGLTRLLGVSGAACGVVLAGFAASDAFWAGAALMAAFGLLANVNSISSQILIQNCVDPAMRARVMSLVGLTFRAVPAASAAVFGGLAVLFGLELPIAAGACLGALCGLWMLALVRGRQLDRRAEGPPAG